MGAATVTAAPLLPADTAGLPGYCCNCGRTARYQICQSCRLAHTDPATGRLAPWLRALRRETNRLWMREHRQERDGIVVLSFDRLPPCALVRPVVGEVGWYSPDYPHPRGAVSPPVAPLVTDFLAGGIWPDDPLVTLRRYSPSGVPLDWLGFMALLGDLFGWPPPGMLVDRRHQESLVDLYERVYPA